MKIRKTESCQPLPVRISSRPTTLENSLGVSYRTNHALTLRPKNCTWAFIPENQSLCLYKTCTWIFITGLFVIAQLLTNQIPLKCKWLHCGVYHEILLSNKKEQNADMYNNLDVISRVSWVKEDNSKRSGRDGCVYRESIR